MLKFDVITLFPEMIDGAVSYGVLGQALQERLLSVTTHNPRTQASDRHRTVDDRPFGGGDGMIMLPETLGKTLLGLKHNTSRVFYLSPQGPTFTDEKARALAKSEHVILICGRYGGIDQRIINSYVDEEISIGDYVLSGGELGALVVIDAVARFIPGVLGHEDSSQKDSFAEGLLEEPHFTRPRSYLQQDVPDILLSGNHKAIAEWKSHVAALVTLKKRPDLFQTYLEATRKEARSQVGVKSKKKSSLDPLLALKAFFENLSQADRVALGLDSLTEEDFNV